MRVMVRSVRKHIKSMFHSINTHALERSLRRKSVTEVVFSRKSKDSHSGYATASKNVFCNANVYAMEGILIHKI